MHANGKRGRPIGSKTFRETPAVKRARNFLERKHAGLKPNAAANEVASNWQVSESTVFKDYERHLSRLITTGISDALSKTALPDFERLVRKAEATATGKCRLTEIKAGRMLIRDYPDIATAFARIHTREFQRALDKLAVRLDTLGDTSGARAVRTFDVPSPADDDWLALLGQQYLAIWRRSRNKTIR